MEAVDREAGPAKGTAWVVSVVLLSLPSLVFVVVHAVSAAGRLPKSLDFAAAWALTLTGMAGALLTLAAVVLSPIATIGRRVRGGANVMMWVVVTCSALACVYLARAPA